MSLCPLYDIVFADQVADLCIVTNIVTTESFSLHGEWELVLDDEGHSGVLVQSETLQVRDLEDMLRKELATDDVTGELFVVMSHEGRFERVPLDDFRTSYREAEITIRVGVGAASYQLTACFFKQPRRCRQIWFWSLTTLYKFLGLATFSGIPSKWVAGSLPSWTKFWKGFSDMVCWCSAPI